MPSTVDHLCYPALLPSVVTDRSADPTLKCLTSDNTASYDFAGSVALGSSLRNARAATATFTN